MKKLLLAGLAGAAALATVSPAQATPTHHWIGGCGFATLSDGTDSSQTKWDGEIHVAAIATDHPTNTPSAGTPISVDCELRINGATPGTIVAHCDGITACANGGQFSFHADPDDVVTMCENVTVGNDFHKDCGNATTTPLIPDPVQQIIDEVVIIADEVICAATKALAGSYGPVAISTDGDVYVDGVWIWDCPPYSITIW